MNKLVRIVFISMALFVVVVVAVVGASAAIHLSISIATYEGIFINDISLYQVVHVYAALVKNRNRMIRTKRGPK